ncbi:MAG: SDR family NAD(P)-dependent oxidoreductase [Bacteroidales bacterium]|nr:SDR family NAD(P)-dependent oxidoreductase [Bacteroidales bacterium]MBN2764593.1 SDR family NAD(P)-dependent oxidoreductase [Bacteroidales bacterium]
MNPEIKDLIKISRYYGSDNEYVIAGGGNTSYKNDRYIWIKASGTSLASVDEKGFVKLSREKIKVIKSKAYSDDVTEREAQVKADLFAAIAEGEQGRPSVETSLHDIIQYAYVVHTHATRANGLLCAKNSKSLAGRIFGDSALYIEYTDPGYILFKKTCERIEQYRAEHNEDPHIILLENHGIFVSADSIKEIRELYDDIDNKLRKENKEKLPDGDKSLPETVRHILPVIRMLLTKGDARIVRIRNNKLIAHFYKDEQSFRKIHAPFTPDIIVYCKSKYLYVEETGSPESVISNVQSQLNRFQKENGFLPKIVLLKNMGLIAVEDSWLAADIALDVFEDMMKISYYSEGAGGPRFLTRDQIDFIDNWEVENYRRQMAGGKKSGNPVDQKIVVVTGAAQGFGEGIARDLMEKNANVVIADINEKKGILFVNELNSKGKKNRALFVKTDVSDADSVREMLFETVKAFGGLDVLVSNAGILRAGDLDEMDPETFELMTRINYNGYFLCVKYAAEILKIQAKYHDKYYTDIIQINSKSGLKGSNKNFAYAGGKFGGIGLTQSFAMELIPYRIKVNAICPGNFFDGPLWSDPVNGLFVQYLKTGKVHGAKTVEDVKKHYESQVPARRGCTVADVMKAIYYVIDQQYETGQAIPVTGGQIMLK